MKQLKTYLKKHNSVCNPEQEFHFREGAQGQRAEDQRDVHSTMVDSIQQARTVRSVLTCGAGRCQHSITVTAWQYGKGLNK